MFRQKIGIRQARAQTGGINILEHREPAPVGECQEEAAGLSDRIRHRKLRIIVPDVGRATGERGIRRRGDAGEWHKPRQSRVVGLPLQAIEVIRAEPDGGGEAGGDLDHVLEPDRGLNIGVTQHRLDQRKRRDPGINSVFRVGVVLQKK